MTLLYNVDHGNKAVTQKLFCLMFLGFFVFFFFTCCCHCSQNAAKPAWNCRCITLAKLQPTGSTCTSRNRRGEREGVAAHTKSVPHAHVGNRQLLRVWHVPFYYRTDNVFGLCVCIDLGVLLHADVLAENRRTWQESAYRCIPLGVVHLCGWRSPGDRNRCCSSHWNYSIISKPVTWWGFSGSPAKKDVNTW